MRVIADYGNQAQIKNDVKITLTLVTTNNFP
jgi:hypothetical protein